MMDWKQHDRFVFMEVKTGKVEVKDEPSLGVAIEGRAKPLTEVGDRIMKSPNFRNSTAQREDRTLLICLIKVRNLLTGRLSPARTGLRSAMRPEHWNSTTGLKVEIDYEHAPKGENIEGGIKINGAGSDIISAYQFTIPIRLGLISASSFRIMVFWLLMLLNIRSDAFWVITELGLYRKCEITTELVHKNARG